MSNNPAVVDAGEVADKKAAVVRIEDDVHHVGDMSHLEVLHYCASPALYVALRGIRQCLQWAV